MFYSSANLYSQEYQFDGTYHEQDIKAIEALENSAPDYSVETEDEFDGIYTPSDLQCIVELENAALDHLNGKIMVFVFQHLVKKIDPLKRK